MDSGVIDEISAFLYQIADEAEVCIVPLNFFQNFE